MAFQGKTNPNPVGCARPIVQVPCALKHVHMYAAYIQYTHTHTYTKCVCVCNMYVCMYVYVCVSVCVEALRTSRINFFF